VNQTYKKIEIIIIDDCSTDGSYDLIKSLYSSFLNIKIYQNKNNIGLTENCCKIFKMTSGKYFFWNAQDDFRDKNYIQKCLNQMEAHPSASLCNSYTAVFYKSSKKIMHINNLNSINQNKNLVSRYWKMSRNYNDVNIYGFMRSNILKNTSLWLPINGSANNLLFELIILGEFIQVKEVLFYYSGQSMYDRPTPAQEYGRQSRKKAFFRFPFLILLINQIISITNKKINIVSKFLLIAIVVVDSFLVNLGKFIFRLLNIFISDKNIPKFLLNFCLFLSYNNKDIEYVVKQNEDKHYYPKHYPLKKNK
jgi:glycosyltransferase involved in cell wall biosynthesis